MLWHFPPSRWLGRFFPEPLPPDGTFNNKTVLITGGTSGLGLAAAQHFVRLGAEVIITCRAMPRGENAKRAIEAAENITDGNRVKVMELDLCSYKSCVKLVEDLKFEYSGRGGIDVAIMNAGYLATHYRTTPDGWEETLQVNTLSTTLLGLLLMGWMKEERRLRDAPAHIVFCTSRDHLYANIKDWTKYADQGGILQHFHDAKNWPSFDPLARPHYAETKLLLTYAIEELADLARGLDGDPQVIINSVCPGVVRTEIGRALSAVSWVMKVGVSIYFGAFGKTPDYGARYFVKAASRPSEEHGRFAIGWLTYEQYLRLGKTVANVTSDHARKVQKLAWAEIISELCGKIPAVAKYVPVDNSKGE